MRNRDMTQGSIWRLLISFAIPILLGNLLQQLYNAFDAMVVGRYVSSDALAAVGTTGQLINVIIAFFMGMSTGSSVLISQYFGSKDQQGVRMAVHTAMLIAVVMGLVLSVVGIVISPYLLRWVRTPEEIIGMSRQYLSIYFVGLVFLTVYNMGTAVLRAMGDSKRPLYFLAISSTLSVLMNLLFVIRFNMGVAGVAWSTVIAQAVSAALVVIAMCRSKGDDQLTLRALRIHWPIAKRIAAIGLPGGIQQSIVGISNTIVQSYFNGLGAIVMAGYSASGKLEAFVTLPMSTMSLAVTAFVGQNLGAHKVKRARKGVYWSVGMGLGITVLMSVMMMLMARQLLGMFTTVPEVLEAGFSFLSVYVPVYFLLCFTQIVPGALRGAGDVRTSTVISIFCFVVLRQIYLFTVTKFVYTVRSVALGYPLTWIVAVVLILVYYRKSDWSRFARADVVET